MLHRGFRIGEHLPTWLLLQLAQQENQPPEKRWAALLALAAKPEPEAFEVVRAMLHHENWEMRRFAVEAVRRHPRNDEARTEIIERLFDVSEEVQQLAIRVCAEYRWPQAHAPITTLLHAASPEVRDTAVNALAGLWREEDFDTLLGIYRADGRRSVRIAAAKTLRACVTPRQWRPLFTLWAHDREARHRLWACELIERFGGRDYLPRLVPLMHDRNWNVREAARGTAERIAA